MMHFQSAFIAVAVLATSLVIADDTLDETKAVEKIKLLGGKVQRNDRLPGRPAVNVSFEGNTKFNDKYLHLLKSLNSLTNLNLSRTKTTGSGLKELREIKSLTTLSLHGTPISSEGLQELKELNNLKSLGEETGGKKRGQVRMALPVV
jgi:internalin A